jgi:hypothetical protein
LEKAAVLARTVHLLCGMKSSKALGAVFLSAAIGWCGFSLAELVYSKLPVGVPGGRQMAVVAVAAAAKAHDGFIAARTAPSVAIAPVADIAKGEPLPEPVAAGPAETDATPASRRGNGRAGRRGI